MLRCLFISLIGLLLFATAASAHEGADHSHPADGSHDTARGIVFEDVNRNGTRDPGEKGIAGVGVSNGATIVKTTEEGRFDLPISDDAIVFVIKPRGWATPLNEQNLPQFYYLHKPKGSPTNSRFAGVKPTGPLPESIDFPLHRQEEPDQFKAILFGDPQPRDLTEVEYIAHDVVEQIIARDAHDASFGVTLGDIVFDDLALMPPLNQAIALIGIPWYNVIGNHDLNFEAADDRHSDETFERIYGPSYYSFDYGPAHFLVLDDVEWHGKTETEKAHYHGGLGSRQMEFIRNDLATIPDDQLIVLMMHIPLNEVKDRQKLYRLIEQRPATVSISAHTHYMEHRLIDTKDGWRGPQRHHHIVNVTVSGSWWRGQKDERGIPHATMSDGGPNGYSVMEFNGNTYSLQLYPAGRAADYQMNIYAPESVAAEDLAETVVVANVFNGSRESSVTMQIDDGPHVSMEGFVGTDPAFVETKGIEEALASKKTIDLPAAHQTDHLYRAMLPPHLSPGTHLIRIEAKHPHGGNSESTRIIRVGP